MNRKAVRDCFIILAVTLVLLEAGSWIAVRFIAKQPDPVRSEAHLFDAHLNHRLNPNMQYAANDPKSRLHSSDGFRRATPVSIVKPERTIRIIALGTSALYGTDSGSSLYPYHRPLYNDETITHVIELALRQRLARDEIDADVEVINAGLTAGRTFHHVMRMNESLLDYSPDIVLNLDGHNDFYAERLTDRWHTYPYSTNLLVDEFNGRTFYLVAFAGVRALATTSNFFNLMEKVFKRLWQVKIHQTTLPHTLKYDVGAINDHRVDIRETARRSYIRDLWQIHRLGEYAGYDHHVFLQPEVVLEETARLSDRDQHIQRITLNKIGSHLDVMTRVRKQLPALFQEAGIPFTDMAELAPYNPDRKTLYIDYCHLTPAGAALLGQRMSEVIYPMVMARISALEPRHRSTQARKINP